MGTIQGFCEQPCQRHLSGFGVLAIRNGGDVAASGWLAS